MPVTIQPNAFVQFVEQGIKKGLLRDVTRTLDGEYYMDMEYLKETLSKQVESHGKINVEKLADILAVEQFTVEKAIENLLNTKDWTVIDDLVLTPDYMESLEEQVEAKLVTSGSISIVAQAQQMKLPYSLLKSVIDSFDDYVIYSQIPDVISTKEYIENCKTEIFKALESAEEPLPMFKLQKSQNIPEDMFYLLLEKVIKSDTFTLGSLRGKRSRAIFEPKSYRNRQIELIKSIFDSNDCISLHTIENLYPYSNAIDLIADNYNSNSYLTLNSCVIKTSVKEKAKDILKSVTDYCDLNDHLPTTLTFDDVNKVLDIIISEVNTNNNQKKLIILEGGYVTTPDFINTTVSQTKNYLRNLARSIKQGNKAESHASAKLNGVQVSSSIIKSIESTGCPHMIAEKIAPLARISIINQFDDILQTPYIEAEEIVSADKWVVEHKARELATLLNIRRSIYFNYQATRLLQDASAKKSLEKFILKNQCTDFLYHLVLYLVLAQSFNKAEVVDSTSLCITVDDIEKNNIADTKQQKYVIAYFIRENDHKYDKTFIIEIEENIKKKDIGLFINDILVKDKHHLFKEELDNAQTKSTANIMIHQQLHNQLQGLNISANTAPQLLHLTTLLLFQQYFGVPLYVSGKFVPVIITEIKSKLEPEQQRLLEIAHLSIINNQREEHLDDYKQLKMIGISCTL
ncbi:hypothetical protein BD770DRAFT_362932 [Pilaira anomala]|nr:hypothetical protein BD770DRAFT_362932 [Pilaira anomala]